MAYIKDWKYIVVDRVNINAQRNIAYIHIDIFEWDRSWKRQPKRIETNVDNILGLVPKNNKDWLKIACYKLLGENLKVIWMEWAVSDADIDNSYLEIEWKIAIFRQNWADIRKYADAMSIDLSEI